MKSKGLKIILIILILLTGSAGGIGFVQSKKQTANNPNEEKNKITYEYYLEDELQETMPVNTPNTTDENGTIVVSEPTYQDSLVQMILPVTLMLITGNLFRKKIKLVHVNFILLKLIIP